MNLKSLIKKLIVLLSLTITCNFSFADESVSILTNGEFDKVVLDKISDSSGLMSSSSKLLTADYKNTAQGQDLPASLALLFNSESKLVIHNAVFKLPLSFEEFTNKALVNKSTIEKYLLYNSKIKASNETFAPCATLSGAIITDMNLPKFLSAFNYPDKLECEIAITHTGRGKRMLRQMTLQQLPKDLKEEDVRSFSLTYSNCNMIFKAIVQNIFFIKSSDGNTLIVFDNYSLVNVWTLEKLDRVKLFIGSSLNFINENVKKNMTGTLKYINSPK